MIVELQSSRVVVMDYRDHKFRSYFGFICWVLIQSEDGTRYAVDGIKLRSNLIDLIKITLDPSILKVVSKDSTMVTDF